MSWRPRSRHGRGARPVVRRDGAYGAVDRPRTGAELAAAEERARRRQAFRDHEYRVRKQLGEFTT